MRDALDVLLALCPPWGPDYPPIGIATLSGYLRGRGYRVRCLDLNVWMHDRALAVPPGDGWRRGRAFPMPEGAPVVEGWNGAWQAMWRPPFLQPFLELFAEPMETFLADIIQVAPLVVGLSVYRDNLHMTLEVARRTRERSGRVAIVCGGPFLPGEIDPALVDPDVVDAFVTGEGEQILERILDTARRGGREAIRGTFGNNRMLAPEPIPDLDEIPFPDYADMDLSPYLPVHAQVLTSRSCPFGCRFCSDRPYMGSFRRRSAEHVLAELEYLTREKNRPYIVFNDLTINADPARLAAICDGIVRRGIRCFWEAQATPHRGTTPRLLAAMRAAGCQALILGLETGSERVARLMNKPFSVDEARRMIRDAHAAGIETKANFVVGYPGERSEDAEETLRFLHEERPSVSAVNVLSLYHLIPQTETWHRRAELGIRDDRADPVRWEAPGNTVEVRVARGERILRMCEALGLPVRNSNVLAIKRMIEIERKTEGTP